MNSVFGPVYNFQENTMFMHFKPDTVSGWDTVGAFGGWQALLAEFRPNIVLNFPFTSEV